MIKLFLAAAFTAITGLSGAAFATDYSIMVPAAPGGGWDKTARMMQSVMQEMGISKNVQVVNVPGGGGTIGLAQFVAQSKGNPTALLMSGDAMVGAILTDRSPVSLADVTPIARLTGESVAIVAPTHSPIKTMRDLVAKLKADPGSVSWAGGSIGSADQIAASLIAKAIGIDPTKINYVAFSGGGEALAAILGGQATVGISYLSEFSSQIETGKLRLLAVSSNKRLLGVDAPTLREAGVDVSVKDWRMVAAAPDITAEQKAAIEEDIRKLVASDLWKETLVTRGWVNTYLSGEALNKQLAEDTAATSRLLKEIGLVK